MYGQTGPNTISGEVVKRKVSKTYSDLTGFDTASAFTVTGTVACIAYGVVGGTAIQSTSGTTTLSVGITNSSALLIAASTIDNNQFVANDVWSDNTPTDPWGGLPSTFQIISNSQDIVLTRSVDDITQGSLTVYVEWYPISSDGNVVAV